MWNTLQKAAVVLPPLGATYQRCDEEDWDQVYNFSFRRLPSKEDLIHIIVTIVTQSLIFPGNFGIISGF